MLCEQFSFCSVRGRAKEVVVLSMISIWSFLLALACVSAVSAEEVAWSDERWTIDGQVEDDEEGGDGVLRLDTGTAVLRDLTLQDGTIDVEIQTSGHRSFVYVQFRRGGEQVRGFDGTEEIYLRAHKSRLPDALQYTPSYPGGSNWQIFHAEDGTAAVELPPGEWVPVRLRFAGQRLDVIVGAPGDGPSELAAREPALRTRLARPARAGHVAVRSFIPRGSEAPFGARFRDLRIDTTVPKLEPLPELAVDPAALRRLRVSASLPVAPDAPAVLEELPVQLAASDEVLQTRADGLLLLHAHRPRPEGARRWAVVVGVDLVAEAAGRRRLDLGFSDSVSVFLNGEMLFGADDSYSFDRPRRQGLVVPDQATVYLPLRAGRNQLRLLVSDGFGGWAIQARIPDREGVRIEP